MSMLFDSFSCLFLASFETDHALFDRFFLNSVPSSAIPQATLGQFIWAWNAPGGYQSQPFAVGATGKTAIAGR
jgi:hypothetical protein